MSSMLPSMSNMGVASSQVGLVLNLRLLLKLSNLETCIGRLEKFPKDVVSFYRWALVKVVSLSLKMVCIVYATNDRLWHIVYTNKIL